MFLLNKTISANICVFIKNMTKLNVKPRTEEFIIPYSNQADLVLIDILKFHTYFTNQLVLHLSEGVLNDNFSKS